VVEYEYPYGFKSPLKYSELELELFLFRIRWPIENGGLGPMGHFKNITRLLWPEKSPAHFFWHPWAEKMISEACSRKYLGVIGCASSGKSDAFAVWAVVNWLCAPQETMVLVTSTSLKDSRKRIWGAITHYFIKSVIPLPGKLVDSIGIIRTDDGTGHFNDRQGIALIAGEKKKEREAIGKMIGMKNTRLFIIADELPELSDAIYEAALSNLATNPEFQMVGIGNFASIYDPLGRFVCPKEGYDSVTPDLTEWETENGYCIRFDGLKSPNILAGQRLWPKIYDGDMLVEHRKTLGQNTVGFWRMVRSFPCPENAENCIYSDADLVSCADKPIWMEPPTRVAGFDPSFTNGGDRSVVVLGSYGMTKEGIMAVCMDRYVLLREDVSIKGKSRSYQVVEQFMKLCLSEKIYPQNAGIDATAAGKAIFDIVAELWSHKVMAVQFGGNASEYPVSYNDFRHARDLYANRVSELWYVGLEFIRSKQLLGIRGDVAREMKSRRYELVKGSQARIKVESKSDMKMRIGFSPDIADALFIMLDLCRVRLGAKCGAKSQAGQRRRLDFSYQNDASQNVYVNADYSDRDADLAYAKNYS
jgi:hypothetical protein